MTQRPIATISIPEGTDTAKLEIMREMIPGGDLHNRYIRDSESKEVLYYCVREPDEAHNDTQLLIHRGGKDGPIIATADPCPAGRYQTDIHFLELNMEVPFEHKHNTTRYCSVKNVFHYKGKKDASTEDAGEVVAEYHPSVFEGNREALKAGDLSLGIKEIQDIVVVTAMVAQEREEETQGPSAMHWRCVTEMGEGGY